MMNAISAIVEMYSADNIGGELTFDYDNAIRSLDDKSAERSIDAINAECPLEAKKLSHDPFICERDAIDWLESSAWRNGRACPHCGSMNTKTVPRRKPMPYRCGTCDKFFGVITGTALAKCKLNVSKLAKAFLVVANDPENASIEDLRTYAGLSRKTAETLLPRVKIVWDGWKSGIANGLDIDSVCHTSRTGYQTAIDIAESLAEPKQIRRREDSNHRPPIGGTTELCENRAEPVGANRPIRAVNFVRGMYGPKFELANPWSSGRVKRMEGKIRVSMDLVDRAQVGAMIDGGAHCVQAVLLAKVMLLVADGKRKDEIASELGKSETKIKRIMNQFVLEGSEVKEPKTYPRQHFPGGSPKSRLVPISDMLSGSAVGRMRELGSMESVSKILDSRAKGPEIIRNHIRVHMGGDERSRLEEVSRNFNTKQKIAKRCNIILMTHDGRKSSEIQEKLGCSRGMINKWLEVFTLSGVEGVTRSQDGSRPPGIKPISTELCVKVYSKTVLETPPGCTHWSCRLMAKEMGISRQSVLRIWRAMDLKPHLIKQFKVSKDPKFEEKLRKIIELYMNYPEDAIVLSFDEKSQIQALDRTHPELPLKPGRCAAKTHDYRRNGTTTLFAAMNVFTGEVLWTFKQTHKAADFIEFLDLIHANIPSGKKISIILDNASSHKTPAVKDWLAQHENFEFHFTPTSSSWSNMIERLFAEVTTRCIRRGSFESVSALTAAVDEYLTNRNIDPQVFVWKKTYEEIEKPRNRAVFCLSEIEALARQRLKSAA